MSNAQYLMASSWKANKADCSTVRNYSAKNRRVKKITTNHKTHILKTKCRNNIILAFWKLHQKWRNVFKNEANIIKLKQKWQNNGYKRLLYSRIFPINMKSWWNEIKTLQETQLAVGNLNRDQSRKNLYYSKHTNKQKPSLSLNAFIRKAFHVLAVKIISHAINYSSSTCQGKFCSNCVCPPPRITLNMLRRDPRHLDKLWEHRDASD